MQTFTNKITLHSVFGNLIRPQHVLIILRDNQGNYLLGVKPDFYPAGIYRFPGGGVEANESPQQAVRREFQEEIGIKPVANDIKLLAQIVTRGIWDKQTFKNTTYLFEYRLKPTDKLTPGDDITALKIHSREELVKLIDAYRSLGLDDWYIENNEKLHNWFDYGQMYAYIHEVALKITS